MTDKESDGGYDLGQVILGTEFQADSEIVLGKRFSTNTDHDILGLNVFIEKGRAHLSDGRLVKTIPIDKPRAKFIVNHLSKVFNLNADTDT